MAPRLSRYALVGRLRAWAGSPRVTHAVMEPFFRLAGFRRHRGIELAEAKRILVVRLDAIGDTVLNTAFLRELRRNAPEAKIDLVVQPRVADLYKICPYVDEVHTFAWAEKERRISLSMNLRALRLAIARIRPQTVR